MQKQAFSVVDLRLLFKLLTEQAPLSLCIKALESYVKSGSKVQAAWYLVWQTDSQIYSHIEVKHSLPPGLGDPLEASDQALHQQLLGQGLMSMADVRQSDSWLAGRLRRAGVNHGFIQVLSLQADQQGVLIVATEDDAHLAYLQGAVDNLDLALQAIKTAHISRSLLAIDPQPTLIVDRHGTVIEGNEALQALVERMGGSDAELLPSNHLALVSSSLLQQRAIERVETQTQKMVFHWSYLPLAAEEHVIVRGKDVTDAITQAREAIQARRLYRLITENTTDLISRHSPDGRFIDASPASWHLLGYWPEELFGQPSQRLFHPDDLTIVEQQAPNALSQNGYYTMTWRVRHKQGHYLWFETASRAIRETYTGDVIEIVSVSRDITERVLVEEHRKRLAEVVEANTDLVLFLSPDGSVTGLNPSAKQALQVQNEQQFSIHQVISYEDFQQLKEQGREQAELQGVWSCEARFKPLCGGQSFPVSLVLLAHRWSSGERYYSMVARNMTERERHEAQQRQHQEELAHTARLVTLGELTSGIAHEMNQPLAAVVNYASASLRYLQQVYQQPEKIERVSQGLQRIIEHAQHAAEVIKQLRSLLRKEPRWMQALAIGQVVNEATRLCQWQANSLNITIRVQVAKNLPVIYADRVLLEQVLLNLLRNAMEANSQTQGVKTSSVWLKAYLEQETNQVVISVADQGAGAQTTDLSQLFAPFYTEKKEGLGLGLSMSRTIIDGFGGSLTVQPLATGGLCFLCYLPLRKLSSE